MSLGSYFICTGVIAPFIYCFPFVKNVNAAQSDEPIGKEIRWLPHLHNMNAPHYVAIGRYLASFA
jgi:hypothetical protein